MAKTFESTMKDATQPSAQLEALKQKEKDLQKETKKALRKIQREKKKLEEDAKLAEEMKVWTKIEQVRSEIAMILHSADIPKKLKSLKALDEFPKGNYKYQHPIKRSRKTNNPDEQWVKDALGEGTRGGSSWTLEQLEATATNSRIRAWKKAMKAKEKKPTPKQIDAMARQGLTYTDGKKNASKDVGVG